MSATLPNFPYPPGLLATLSAGGRPPFMTPGAASQITAAGLIGAMGTLGSQLASMPQQLVAPSQPQPVLNNSAAVTAAAALTSMAQSHNNPLVIPPHHSMINHAANIMSAAPMMLPAPPSIHQQQQHPVVSPIINHNGPGTAMNSVGASTTTATLIDKVGDTGEQQQQLQMANGNNMDEEEAGDCGGEAPDEAQLKIDDNDSAIDNQYEQQQHSDDNDINGADGESANGDDSEGNVVDSSTTTTTKVGTKRKTDDGRCNGEKAKCAKIDKVESSTPPISDTANGQSSPNDN